MYAYTVTNCENLKTFYFELNHAFNRWSDACYYNMRWAQREFKLDFRVNEPQLLKLSRGMLIPALNDLMAKLYERINEKVIKYASFNIKEPCKYKVCNWKYFENMCVWCALLCFGVLSLQKCKQK